MSGFTTTGSSILTQPSALSRGVGFWRCFTHFVGGFGIVLFALVILPMMGAGGMSLFRAEAAGPIAEKLTPRLKDTVRILLIVYLSLNVACAALLWLFGMDLYDAVAHSFGTIATGGFSTRDTSIATFASPAIEWVITVFMLLSGINFTLYYILVRKRDWRAVLRDGELRLFLGLFVAATVLIGILLIGELGWEWSRALRASAFQVASLFTTAGFATEDYNLWPSFAGLTLVGLMVVGGMAGSTSGGLKTIRLGMVLAILRKVLRRTLQPQAISPARFGGRTLGNELILDVMALVGFYFCFWGISTLYLAWQGCAFDEAVAGVTACLSNAGPGLGRMGPMGNYAHLGADIKLLLTADMLLGRLEFLTVLVVFSRHFWRR
jgi:trk system potassium uptake protein TrkH